MSADCPPIRAFLVKELLEQRRNRTHDPRRQQNVVASLACGGLLRESSEQPAANAHSMGGDGIGEADLQLWRSNSNQRHGAFNYLRNLTAWRSSGSLGFQKGTFVRFEHFLGGQSRLLGGTYGTGNSTSYSGRPR